MLITTETLIRKTVTCQRTEIDAVLSHWQSEGYKVLECRASSLASQLKVSAAGTLELVPIDPKANYIIVVERQDDVRSTTTPSS